jgi:hypothetical protein
MAITVAEKVLIAGGVLNLAYYGSSHSGFDLPLSAR